MGEVIGKCSQCSSFLIWKWSNINKKWFLGCPNWKKGCKPKTTVSENTKNYVSRPDNEQQITYKSKKRATAKINKIDKIIEKLNNKKTKLNQLIFGSFENNNIKNISSNNFEKLNNKNDININQREFEKNSSDYSKYFNVADKINCLYIAEVGYYNNQKLSIINKMIERYKENNPKSNFLNNSQNKEEKNTGQINAWLNNLGAISNIIEEANIDSTTLMIFEWRLLSSCIVDLTLIGSGSKSNTNLLTIELKNWSPNSKKIDFLLKNHKSPFKQLQDNNSGIEQKLKDLNIQGIDNIYSCAYLPNYEYPKNLNNINIWRKMDHYIIKEHQDYISKINQDQNLYFAIVNNKEGLIKALRQNFNCKNLKDIDSLANDLKIRL